MTFVYPSFLWALGAIAIPIIIHLFNFRTHKTVYFSNVAFLQSIEQESKAKNKLKEWLILLMRILAIVALVLAFAKPVLKSDAITIANCNSYSVYVDNSFSMSALSNDGANIDVAKDRATDIVNAFPNNSVYLFLSNEITPQQQHFYPKDIILSNVSAVQTTPIFRKTNFIVQKLSELLYSTDEKQECPKKIFIISDFQKNTFDPQNFSPDSSLFYYLVPVTPVENSNLSVDSLWFESPYHAYNAADSLIVRIRNFSGNDFHNRQIKLFLNDSLKTITNFDVSANNFTDVKIVFSNLSKGLIQAKVQIDDYPITYDNIAYFNYEIISKAKVLLLNDDNLTILQKFYSDSNNFELTFSKISNINISQINNYNAVIIEASNEISSGLKTTLIDYVDNGGNLIIIPPRNSKTDQLNDLLTSLNCPTFSSFDTSKFVIRKIDLTDKIYRNSFEKIEHNSIMPTVFGHYKINGNFQTTQLLNLENDDIFLYSKTYNNGNVYVFSTDIAQNSTDLMYNPISVPTFFNIPYISKSANKDYYVVGNNTNIELKNITNDEALKVKNLQTNVEFFPQISKTSKNSIILGLNEEINQAGNYLIFSNDKQVGAFSLNYNRKESDMKFYNSSELENILKSHKLKNYKIIDASGLKLQKDVTSNFKTSNLWKICIIFALLFLLGEILLIRFFKIKNKKNG